MHKDIARCTIPSVVTPRKDMLPVSNDSTMLKLAETKFLQIAQPLVEAGFKIHPLYSVNANGVCQCPEGSTCSSVGKHPILKGWQHKATSNLAAVKGWAYQYPNANVGVLIEPGFIVLDIDPRNGGQVSFEGLLEQYDPMPETLTVQTGGGGWHYYLKLPDIALTQLPANLAAIGFPGIDVKAPGSYVVGPGSLHKSGQPYEWEVSSSPDLIEMATAPEWLITLITGVTHVGVREPQTIISKPLKDGEGRNQLLHKVGSSLKGQGVCNHLIASSLPAVNQALCLDPLPDGELENIIKSVSKYPEPSRSAPPIEFPPDEAEGAKPRKAKIMPEITLISLPELQKKEFPAVKWIIPGMLPEGMCLFAGGSKMGKSWFALDLAIQVAQGGVILGDREVLHGKVIYFALEDNARRLKVRCAKLLNGIEGPSNLLFSTAIPKLDQTGLTALISVLNDHPDCVLVIIDTMVRATPAKSGNRTDYDADSEILGRIQSLAGEKGICILFIHHTRKDGQRTGDDPFQEILGSTGIVGVADTMWMLKKARVEESATLYITGRDVEGQTYNIVFNADTCIWSPDNATPEAKPLSDTEQKIVFCFTTDAVVLSPKEVSDRTGVNDDTVRKAMTRMVDKGILTKPSPGKYKKSVTVSRNALTVGTVCDLAVTDDMSLDVPEHIQAQFKEFMNLDTQGFVTPPVTEPVTPLEPSEASD
jgi:hypothetical protein